MRTRQEKVKMVVQSPSDRNTVVWLPYAVAFAAARGIATGTYFVPILFGPYGTARFNQHGAGTVEWNEQSTCPGETTRFSENTVVCI